jgi:signal transduction histidine kinase
MNAVLDISRVETGAMSLSLEPVSVAGSIAGVIDLLHSVAYASGHAIDTDLTDAANAYVLADQQRLRQVLTNLVSNALKYNRAGGRVDLRALRVGNRVRLEVADQGDGLSEGEMALLFVPFERLNAASHGIEGTGLGLALSKTLTETMGGKIGASSTPGEGSTFYVELAAIEPSTLDMTDATHHRLVASRDYERRFVLLYVDDVSANVRLVTEILKRRPMIELVSATSGVASQILTAKRCSAG